MHITYKGDYALKAILDLAIAYGSEPMTIQDLADKSDIPLKFLEQILLDLKRGGFVESRRGKVGGYLLARPPAKITLREVVSFIDGTVEPIACVDREYKGCRDAQACVFRDIWQQVTQATTKILDNVTFEDLVKKARRFNKSLSYNI